MAKDRENKVRKTRFNIIDLVIVLFIVMAIVGIFMRFNLAEEINIHALGEVFEIEFLIGDIQEASQDFLVPGERFYMELASIEIGTIIRIDDIRNPAPAYVTDINGNIIKSELPGRIEVIGVMESRGRTNRDGNHMINGNIFIAPNRELLVHTGKIEGLIRILSVTKVN
jgi:hypothetical protein